MIAFFNVDLTQKLAVITEPLKEAVRTSSQEAVYRNISITEGNLSEVLGNKSLAKLKKRDLKLMINPLLSEADPGSVSAPRAESFSPPNFPKEIYTSYDVSYNEKIAKQNQQIIKNYFEQINT